MKKILIYAIVISTALLSCNDDGEILLDVNDPANSIAQLNSTVVFFNPVEDLENIINVGVSTLSDTDRTFVATIGATDDEDFIDLDPSFYNIESLTGVIPAGSFIGEIIVNTPAPGENLPPGNAVLNLELQSVEGAQLLESSNLVDDFEIGFVCPTVELDIVVGNAVTVANRLLEAFGVDATFSDPRTVVAGPADNQLTIIGGLSPAIGSSDIILTVDLETGLATGTATPEETSEDLPLGNSFTNGGVPTVTTSINGQVLSCIGQISFTIGNSTFAPPFNSNTVVLQF